MQPDIRKYAGGGVGITRIVHEPGNGTRYEAVGVKMPDDFPGLKNYWLVSFPLHGVFYYFVERGSVAVSYVAEKLGHDRNGAAISDTDLHEMTKLVALITNGRHDAATTSKGRLTNLHIAQ